MRKLVNLMLKLVIFMRKNTTPNFILQKKDQKRKQNKL
jgi:hypothetical protein